jgi:hypothetical protein
LRRFCVILAIAIVGTAEVACDRGPKIGAPVRIAKVGDHQSSDAGTPVPNAPGVMIFDANDHGVPGVTVNFSVTSGGGAVQNASSGTDQSGTASAGSWTLGTLAGAQTLRASVVDVPGSPVTLAANARAGPIASLTKVGSEPVSSPASGNIDSIIVRAADQFGNAVANETVAFAVTAGGGSISPPSRVTLADGRAAARWTLGSEIGVSNMAKASRPDGSLAVIFATTSTQPIASVRFADHVMVVDSGSSITPSISVLDPSGAEVPGAPATLSVRNVAVANAGSSLTGLKAGQTFAIATSLDNSSARDSAMLVVAAAGKPAVTLTMPRFDLAVDTTFTVSLILDSRSVATPVGSATLQVVWNTSVLTFVSEQAGSVSNALVDVNTAATASGVLTVGMASGSGVTGAVELRTITFKASSTANRTGTLSVDVAEISAAGTFADLTGLTVSGTYPLRIR